MQRDIRAELAALADPEYKRFHAGLVPTLDPDTILGVRMPALRRYAKSLASSDDAREFITLLPHPTYEENTLHALLIEREGDFDELCAQLDRFLPFVDNWATCDVMSPKLFKKHPDGLLQRAASWAGSSHTYTCRFGVGVLMRCFLDERFSPEILDIVAEIPCGDYYIDMMRAWFFCEALIKRYDSAVAVLEAGRLDAFTHNKAIQKARESFRIDEAKKQYLKSLKAMA